jgi:PqqD family protein of HPr-rel-A system
LTLWRLREPLSLHGRSWDDGAVLFHAPSGDTHLLDPSAAAAILLLREGAKDVPAMLGAAQGGVDRARLEALLQELETLGVVARA